MIQSNNTSIIEILQYGLKHGMSLPKIVGDIIEQSPTTEAPLGSVYTGQTYKGKPIYAMYIEGAFALVADDFYNDGFDLNITPEGNEQFVMPPNVQNVLRTTFFYTNLVGERGAFESSAALNVVINLNDNTFRVKGSANINGSDLLSFVPFMEASYDVQIYYTL